MILMQFILSKSLRMLFFFNFHTFRSDFLRIKYKTRQSLPPNIIIEYSVVRMILKSLY